MAAATDSESPLNREAGVLNQEGTMLILTTLTILWICFPLLARVILPAGSARRFCTFLPLYLPTARRGYFRYDYRFLTWLLQPWFTAVLMFTSFLQRHLVLLRGVPPSPPALTMN